MRKQIDIISLDQLRRWIEAKKSLMIIDTLPAEIFRQRLTLILTGRAGT